jgi:integrase
MGSKTAMIISTVLQVKNAKPGVHRIAGVKATYLKVAEPPSEAASYFYRYRLAGRRREFGLGSRDEITLANARVAAQEAAALVRLGIDPVDNRKSVRLENIAKKKIGPTLTFKQMVEKSVDPLGANWRGRYARTSWLRLFELHVYPVIADLTLEEITIDHVEEVMKRAREVKRRRPKGMKSDQKPPAPVVAHKARAKIYQILKRAIRRSGKAMINVADAEFHAKAPPKSERPHFRAVKPSAAPEIFREIKTQAAAHAGLLTGTALNAWLLMILTASRPSEALYAPWSEVDLDEGTWTVPATRMKAKKPHTVMLSSAAVGLLGELRRVSTGSLIFPGRGGSRMSYDAFTKAPTRAGIDAASPHGWRSTFCAWASGKIPPDLVEHALAHALPPVMAAYKRDTSPEALLDMMERYSAWLNDDGAAKVIAFPTSKKT